MSRAESFLNRQRRKSNTDKTVFHSVQTQPKCAVERKTDFAQEPPPMQCQQQTSFSHDSNYNQNNISQSCFQPKKTSIGLMVVLGIPFLAVFAYCFSLINDVTDNSANSFSDVNERVFSVITKTNKGELSLGTAFAVDSRNLITNKHVVIESSSPRVHIAHPEWNNPRRAIVKEISPSFDLAWLQMEDQSVKLNPLKISDSMAEQGDKVYAFGYPGYSYDQSNSIPQVTMSEGIIKAPQRTLAGNPCYETSATINGGNSGGPLLNQNLQVIGVNTFSLEKMSNCFYAIHAETIKFAFPRLWNKIK